LDKFSDGIRAPGKSGFKCRLKHALFLKEALDCKSGLARFLSPNVYSLLTKIRQYLLREQARLLHHGRLALTVGMRNR
jgi:hypothetical protein